MDFCDSLNLFCIHHVFFSGNHEQFETRIWRWFQNKQGKEWQNEIPFISPRKAGDHVIPRFKLTKQSILFEDEVTNEINETLNSDQIVNEEEKYNVMVIIGI